MKNKPAIIFLLIISFFATCLSGFAQTLSPNSLSAPINYVQEVGNEKAVAEVKVAFANWRDYLSSGSPEKIVRLYAKDAILIPTLSAKIYNTPEERKEYFDKLMANKNLKVSVEEDYIKVYGRFAVNSGLYTFSYTDAAGKDVSFPARFSFVYYKMPQAWVIINHHSSRTPEK